MEYSRYPEAANDSVLPDGTVDFDDPGGRDVRYDAGVDQGYNHTQTQGVDVRYEDFIPGPPDDEEYDDGEIRELNRRSGKGVYVIMAVVALFAIAALAVGSTILVKNNQKRSIESAQQEAVGTNAPTAPTPTPSVPNSYAPASSQGPAPTTSLPPVATSYAPAPSQGLTPTTVPPAVTYAPTFRGTNLLKTYVPTLTGTEGWISSTTAATTSVAATNVDNTSGTAAATAASAATSAVASTAAASSTTDAPPFTSSTITFTASTVEAGEGTGSDAPTAAIEPTIISSNFTAGSDAPTAVIEPTIISSNFTTSTATSATPESTTDAPPFTSSTITFTASTVEAGEGTGSDAPTAATGLTSSSPSVNPPVAAIEGGHLGADGCLREGEAQTDLCIPDVPIRPRAVNCCSGSMDDDSLICSRGPTCYYAASYADAVARCEDNDMRLCTVAEMESGVCCNQGCNFDFRVGWTSDVCGINIGLGPSPTFEPVQTDSPTTQTMSTVTTIQTYSPSIETPTMNPKASTSVPTVSALRDPTQPPSPTVISAVSPSTPAPTPLSPSSNASASATTVSPTEQLTNAPTVFSQPSSETCSISIEVDFVTEDEGNLDKTGYSLLSDAGTKSTIYMEAKPGDLSNFTTHNDVACVSKGAYIFTVSDESGNCCGVNKGYFAVKVNGEEVVRGSQYFEDPEAYIIRTDYEPPTDETKVQWLNKHNEVRQTFHTENDVSFKQLVWSESLTQAAADRANDIALTCGYDSPDSQPWGENLSTTTFDGYNDMYVSPDYVFDGWTDPVMHPLTFRQVMWRSTRYVGCASNIAQMSENGLYCHVVVCKYARPGNCNVNNDAWLNQTLADYSACDPACAYEGCY